MRKDYKKGAKDRKDIAFIAMAKPYVLRQVAIARSKKGKAFNDQLPKPEDPITPPPSPKQTCYGFGGGGRNNNKL